MHALSPSRFESTAGRRPPGGDGTKTEHALPADEVQGIVRRLALRADQTIVMLVLVQVDRFLVKIGPRGVMRIDVDRPAIARMQFHLDEISNVAIEVVSTP
jgi:hypothetical protein